MVETGRPPAEANYDIPPALNETGEWNGEARTGSENSCIEADKVDVDEGLGYDNVRSAGTYQVRAVQSHNRGDGTAAAHEEYLLFSDPVTVTIPDPGLGVQATGVT